MRGITTRETGCGEAEKVESLEEKIVDILSRVRSIRDGRSRDLRMAINEAREKHLDLNEIFQRAFETFLKNGWGGPIRMVVNFAGENGFSLDIDKNKAEITSACQEELERELSYGHPVMDIFNFVVQNRISLNFTEQKFVSACKKGLEARLRKRDLRYMDDTVSFIEWAGIPIDLVSTFQAALEDIRQRGAMPGVKEELIGVAKKHGIPIKI